MGHPRVRTRHHREQQRRITHVARQAGDPERLPVVERRPVGDAPQRGPQADHPAERRRVAQRATHVRAVRQWQHARGEGRRRSPARPARGTARVRRVARGPEDRVEGVRAGRELRHVGPAQQYDARPADPLDRQRVLVGHEVGMERRAEGRAPARHGVGVLHCEREPVQRADRVTGGQPLVGGCRRAARPLGVQRHDGVDLAVALLDPREVQVEQLARRDLARMYGGRLVARRRVDGDVAHRRRPASTVPAATPSRTRPAPTAIPLRKSSCEPIAPARGGAVNTPVAAALSASSAGVRGPRSRSRRCRRTPWPSAWRHWSASAGRRHRPSLRRRRPPRRRSG